MRSSGLCSLWQKGQRVMGRPGRRMSLRRRARRAMRSDFWLESVCLCSSCIPGSLLFQAKTSGASHFSRFRTASPSLKYMNLEQSASAAWWACDRLAAIIRSNSVGRASRYFTCLEGRMVFDCENGCGERYRLFRPILCGVELLYSRGESESVARKRSIGNPEEGRGVPSAGLFSMLSSRLPMKLEAMPNVEDKYIRRRKQCRHFESVKWLMTMLNEYRC